MRQILANDILRINETGNCSKTTGRGFRCMGNEVKAFVFMILYDLFHCYSSDGEEEEEQVIWKYLVQHLAARKRAT